MISLSPLDKYRENLSNWPRPFLPTHFLVQYALIALTSKATHIYRYIAAKQTTAQVFQMLSCLLSFPANVGIHFS